MMSGFLTRTRGLLGTDRSAAEEAGMALLTPCRSIHTFGMRYPIDVAFLSSDGTVLKSVRSLAPCRVESCRRCTAVLERPASSDLGWWSPGERVGLAPVWSATGDPDSDSRRDVHARPGSDEANAAGARDRGEEMTVR